MDFNFHDVLGLKLGSVMAGFLGGLVKGLIMPNVTMTQTIISCVIGGITAGYLTTPIMYWLPWATVTGAEGAVGYAIGLTAMLICEGIIKYVSRWRDNPTIPPKQDE